MAEFVNNGDRVRIVIEGVYTGDPLEVGTFGPDRLFEVGSTEHDDTVSVEKIEPPVVTFEPGDVVQSLRTGSLWYLATNGYVRMASLEFPNAVQFYEYDGSESFTSEDYEKVTLG